MLNDYVLNIVMAGTIHVAVHEALLIKKTIIQEINDES